MKRLLVLTLQRLGATIIELQNNTIIVVEEEFHEKAKELSRELIDPKILGFEVLPIDDWYVKNAKHQSGLYILL